MGRKAIILISIVVFFIVIERYNGFFSNFNVADKFNFFCKEQFNTKAGRMLGSSIENIKIFCFTPHVNFINIAEINLCNIVQGINISFGKFNCLDDDISFWAYHHRNVFHFIICKFEIIGKFMIKNITTYTNSQIPRWGISTIFPVCKKLPFCLFRFSNISHFFKFNVFEKYESSLSRNQSFFSEASLPNRHTSQNSSEQYKKSSKKNKKAVSNSEPVTKEYIELGSLVSSFICNVIGFVLLVFGVICFLNQKLTWGFFLLICGLIFVLDGTLGLLLGWDVWSLWRYL